MVLARLVNAIRWRLSPSEHERELKRFYVDGGKELLFTDLKLDNGSLVLDAGGYDGQWASDVYARYRPRIIIFEPVQQQAEQIARRFCRNSDIKVVAAGLGSRTRSETMWVRGPSSSIFPSNCRSCSTGSVQRQMIQIYDVYEIWRDWSIGKVDLLKINVEGCEYEILERLISTGLITQITTLLVQFHQVDTDSEDRMCSIVSGLRETHYPIYQYKFVWERWDRIEGVD